MDGKKQCGSEAKETQSICSELNLDMAKLNDECLMNDPIYRRLCNIVNNDMSRSDLSFRKNLIKELYFLLQITPIIRPELKDSFLAQVEKWYNLNDHKKIDLASNKLNNLLSMVHSKKESEHGVTPVMERPKTGVTWDQKVSPFLRPYTAKRSSKLKTNKNNRPDSSKLGSQSTKVETVEDFCIRQFTTNIQEQLQISQDFIQKHRTSHPDYQPIYEQLYNILKKIQTIPESQKQVSTGKPLQKGARFAKSAILRKQNSISKEAEVKSQHSMSKQSQIDNLIEQKPTLGEEKCSDQQPSSDEQEYLYVNDDKKQYKAFSKTFKVQENDQYFQQKPGLLSKYTHLANNRLVQAMREDKEMAKKYVEFAKLKSAMRREQSRKSQSKRLMSAKQSSSVGVKFRKINQTIHEQFKQNIEQTKGIVIDLSKDSKSVHANFINPYPTYNRQQFLKKVHDQQVNKYKIDNKIEEVSANIKKGVKRPMTSFIRFNSHIRFDPFSEDNVKKYNQEALDEIQKIKMKVGGKCSASTDSLMKALVIDTIHKEELPKWQTKNPGYGLLSTGSTKKKLKKKKRVIDSKKDLPLR